MKVTIKLSGSLFNNPFREIRRLSRVITRLYRNEGIRFALVAGGGKIARTYISLGRKLGMDESSLDELGIAVTRLNARLIIAGLRDIAYPKVPSSLEELDLAFSTGKVVVMGGLYPGQSTNAVAALVAERIKSDLFLNTTNVEGIYDKDPSIYPNAKLFKQIGVEELKELLKDKAFVAGTYELLDPISVRVIERSKIKCIVLKYDPSLIEKAIKMGNVGTTIVV